MLRRNIDTNAGLVNGAIGTVVSVRPNHVTVQFDHTNTLYKVEKVKSRFAVMKYFYIYRRQFPLILAYAVTIHKCQGLSLDCAIVDLSDKVFSAGMAYVAVSRVCTLQGLHLVAFEPESIMVSTSCLKEINRLRATYRPDLNPHPLPAPPKADRKRNMTTLNPRNHVVPTLALLTKESSLLVQVRQLPLRKLQQKEKERSWPNQQMTNLLRRHVVPTRLTFNFCTKSLTYLTNFIQWMSNGNVTCVTLWAFGFVGQTG